MGGGGDWGPTSGSTDRQELAVCASETVKLAVLLACER